MKFTALRAELTCSCGCFVGECPCPFDCPCGCNAVYPARKQNVRAATGKVSCVLSPSGTYMDATSCDATGQCNWKYSCVNKSCMLTADGTFATQDDCFGSAGKCGWNWKCVSGACVQDLTGTFASKTECESSADPTLGRCGWKWDCAVVTQDQATKDPAGYNYDYQGKLFQVVDANKSKVKNTAQELMCVSPSTTSPGPSCTCGYDPARPGTFGTLASCAASATGRCGWKWGCASVTQADETADPAGTSYQYQGKLMAVTDANRALLKDRKEDLKCISASTSTGGPLCVCQYSATATPTFTTMDACAADATAKCGWKWDCATVTAAEGNTSTTSYEYQGKLFQVTSANSSRVKNTAAELQCVSASSSSWNGGGGPSCTCAYNPSVPSPYTSITQCVGNGIDKCEWQYGCGTVDFIPNAVDAAGTTAGIYYVDTKAKTKRLYPNMDVFKSWWPQATTYGVDINAYANDPKGNMVMRTGSDVPFTDVNYERQTRLLQPTTSVDASGKYKTYTGKAWYGNGAILAQTTGGTQDACVQSVLATANSTGGVYNTENKKCLVYGGNGAVMYGLGTDVAIIRTANISDPALSKNCVYPNGAAGVSCTCGGPTSSANWGLPFDTITACKADPTAQCGWKFTCPAGNTINGSSGGITLAFSTLQGSSTSGKEYLQPISEPFVAYKEFIRVNIGNGTITLPTARTGQTTTAGGTDSAEGRFVVRGYSNYVLNKDDDAAAGTMIIWGDNGTATNAARDVAQTIPGLHANGNTGRAVVGMQYKVYIRMYVKTDDDIKLTWPTFSIEQMDAATAGYTLATVSNQPLPSYPSAVTATGPNGNCLWYPWRSGSSISPQAGRMFSPDGTKLLERGQDGNGNTYWLRVYDLSQNNKVLFTDNVVFPHIPPSSLNRNNFTALCMQQDGNAVAYDYNYNAYGATGTNGKGTPPYTWALDNTGVVTLKDKSGTTLYSTAGPASQTFAGGGKRKMEQGVNGLFAGGWTYAKYYYIRLTPPFAVRKKYFKISQPNGTYLRAFTRNGSGDDQHGIQLLVLPYIPDKAGPQQTATNPNPSDPVSSGATELGTYASVITGEGTVNSQNTLPLPALTGPAGWSDWPSNAIASGTQDTDDGRDGDSEVWSFFGQGNVAKWSEDANYRNFKTATDPAPQFYAVYMMYYDATDDNLEITSWPQFTVQQSDTPL